MMSTSSSRQGSVAEMYANQRHMVGKETTVLGSCGRVKARRDEDVDV